MLRLARGGGLWVGVALGATVALALPGLLLPHDGLLIASLGPAVIAIFFVNFFRDPERAAAQGLASPADGKVVRIDSPFDPDVGDADRIAIFMSPLDVHVNRFPLDGTVVSVTHRDGAHVPAFDKDSDRNERVETLLDTPYGRVKVVQIAGTVARRIVPYVFSGPAVKGQRMGLIRLGSRCDVYIPKGRVSWKVSLGDPVQAGSTSLGALSDVTVVLAGPGHGVGGVTVRETPPRSRPLEVAQ